MVTHYKSWSNLKKQLEERLADSLKGKITYFYTNYHSVHNSYGRAAILYNKREIAVFDFSATFKQECEPIYTDADYATAFTQEFCPKGIINEANFLQAATEFLNTDITATLNSENLLLKIFAILDSRVGKRTLKKLSAEATYKLLPDYVKQFYEIRFEEEGIFN